MKVKEQQPGNQMPDVNDRVSHSFRDLGKAIVRVVKSIFIWIGEQFLRLFSCCSRRETIKRVPSDVDLKGAAPLFNPGILESDSDNEDNKEIKGPPPQASLNTTHVHSGEFATPQEKSCQKFLYLCERYIDEKCVDLALDDKAKKEILDELFVFHQVIIGTKTVDIANPIIEIVEGYLKGEVGEIAGFSEGTNRVLKLVLSGKPDLQSVLRGKVTVKFNEAKSIVEPEKLQAFLNAKVSSACMNLFSGIHQQKLFMEHVEAFSPDLFPIFSKAKVDLQAFQTELDEKVGTFNTKTLLRELPKFIDQSFPESKVEARGYLKFEILEIVKEFKGSSEGLVKELNLLGNNKLTHLAVKTISSSLSGDKNFKEMVDRMVELFQETAPNYWDESRRPLIHEKMLEMLTCDLELFFRKNISDPANYVKIRKAHEVDLKNKWKKTVNQAKEKSAFDMRVGEIALILLQDKRFGNFGSRLLKFDTLSNYFKNIVTEAYTVFVQRFHHDGTFLIDFINSLIEADLKGGDEVKSEDHTEDMSKILYDMIYHTASWKKQNWMYNKLNHRVRAVLGTPKDFNETVKRAVVGLTNQTSCIEGEECKHEDGDDGLLDPVCEGTAKKRNHTFIAKVQGAILGAWENTVVALSPDRVTQS